VSFGFSRDRWYNYIADRSHPPVVSAVVEKPEYDPDHVYAWKPAENYKGWKLIARGEAGVDDAEVIQKALDVGGVVVLADMFTINKAVKIGDNTVLRGLGWHTGLKLADGAEDEVIQNKDQTNGNQNIVIENMQIDGNKANQAGTNTSRNDYNPIELWHVTNAIVRNCYVHDGYGGAGINVAFSKNAWVIGNRVKNCGATPTNPGISDSIFVSGENIYVINNYTTGSTDTGIAVDYGVNRVIVHGNVIDGDRFGIQIGGNDGDITGVQNVLISNNIIRNPSDHIHMRILHFGANKMPNKIFIIGNKLIGNGRVLIGDYDVGVIEDIVFVNNEYVDNNIEEYAIVIEYANRVVFANNKLTGGVYFHKVVNNAIVSGNYIENSYYTGLHLLGGKNSIVSSNLIRNPNQSNTTTDSEACGLILRDYDGSLSECRVIGNIVIDDQSTKTMKYALLLDVTGDNILIENNTFGSGTSGVVHIVHSTAKFRNNVGYTTENSGTATFSGDGSTTQFKIEHGLVSTPSKVLVTPMSADAAGDFYVTADADYIYINYSSAPASGTDNVKVSWYAEV